MSEENDFVSNFEDTPVPDPVAEPAPAPAEAKEPEPAPEPAPEAKATPPDIQEIRSRLLGEIAERYKLSEEMAQRFSTEPHAVLPQVVASLYLDIYDAVMNVITQQMPGMLGQVMAMRQAEEQFFQRWPELRDPKYHKAIRDVAMALKSAEPNINPEQARERVGATVMAMFGLKPSSQPPRPVRPPVPASPGGVASQAAGDVAKTIWDELVEVL